MGICASSQMTRRGGAMKWPPTAMLIDTNGHLQEFKQQIRAGTILSQHPNTFLCSSEAMFVGSHVPHLPSHEELQLGQIYFLLPISKSQAPLSLQDLCALAIKASTALDNSVPPLDTSGGGFLAGCGAQIAGLGVAEMGSEAVARSSRRIEF